MRVTVALATCGRLQGLAQALDSLAAQQGLGEVDVVVAVVDNHRLATARDAVAARAAHFPFQLQYAHEPQPGVSHARNRLVRMAGGSDYVAFIDDDEEACRCWLSELVRVALETRAAAVLGPVLPVLPPDLPAWMGPLFERPRHPDGSQVGLSDFRSGNTLVATRALSGVPGPFDPAFALSGGSDTVLGMALSDRGERFAWADRAVVTEQVPEDRANARWYLRRRFRSGHVYAKALRTRGGLPQAVLRALYRGVGSLGVGSVSAARSAFLRDRLRTLEALGLLAYGVGCLSGPVEALRPEYEGRASV